MNLIQDKVFFKWWQKARAVLEDPKEEGGNPSDELIKIKEKYE